MIEKKETEKYFSPTDFARIVGCSNTTIYNYIHSGKIKYIIKKRGLDENKLIPEKELEKFK